MLVERGMSGRWVGRFFGAGWVLVVGCAGTPEAASPTAINPQSVPSLALLSGGLRRGEDVSGSGSGDSCEVVSNEALQRAREQGAGEEAPAEHGDQIREVLNSGGFLNDCEVPSTAGVELCVAVIDGMAKGVTVWVRPGTVEDANCVADRIRALAFPEHELVSIARTNFDPS